MPIEVFANLVNDCPNVLALVINELASTNVDNVEVASKAICELLFLSRNMPEFNSIREYVAANTDKLLSSAGIAI